MEWDAQAKRHPNWWTALKVINFTCKKNSHRMKSSQPAFIIPSQLGKRAGPL